MAMAFYREAKHKANILHFCTLCGERIESGTTYFKQVGKFNGEFFQRDLHPQCKFIIDAYMHDNNDEDLDFTAVLDYAKKEICSQCKQNKKLSIFKNKINCNQKMSTCPTFKEKVFKEFHFEENPILGVVSREG